MNHKGNFKKDLEFSQRAEDYTVKRLREKYPLSKRILGYNKECDIIIPERNETLEVKADRKTKKTKNLFIEYESREFPSGIKTTTADWWFYYYDENDFITITPENNMVVMFPSEYWHEVKTVNNDGNLTNNRFTINIWIH